MLLSGVNLPDPPRSIFSATEETSSRGVYVRALCPRQMFFKYSLIREQRVGAQGKYRRPFPRLQRTDVSGSLIRSRKSVSKKKSTLVAQARPLNVQARIKSEFRLCRCVKCCSYNPPPPLRNCLAAPQAGQQSSLISCDCVAALSSLLSQLMGTKQQNNRLLRPPSLRQRPRWVGGWGGGFTCADLRGVRPPMSAVILSPFAN